VTCSAWRQVTTIIAAATYTGMSPDQPPSPPPAKPKLSSEERRIRQADRLKCIRLRMAIGKELDDRDITTPTAIGQALGMPAAGPPQSWGSRGDGRLRVRAISGLKALLGAGTRDAGAVGTVDLPQLTPNFAAVPGPYSPHR